MSTLAELKVELEDATTLKRISQAFTEAAGARIQKIKREFETNREFYEEISHVYHLLRSGDDRPQEKNKAIKTLAVAVTSNQRFYGTLNVNIMKTFCDEAHKKSGRELLVIGTTGRDYMKSIGYPRAYEQMNFRHDFPTSAELSGFLDHVAQYSSVIMFYPKFVTLLTQTAGSMDICQAATPGEKIPETEQHMIFEPEYSIMLAFFSRQVRALLFRRVMLEADLSRTAARLISMSAADERSTEMIKINKSKVRKMQLSITNAKLLETFTAVSASRRQ